VEKWEKEGRKGERWLVGVREFHGEYEGELGFSWSFDLMSRR
jgi:hypothetical protein